jgi:hypothetical protein
MKMFHMKQFLLTAFLATLFLVSPALAETNNLRYNSTSQSVTTGSLIENQADANGALLVQQNAASVNTWQYAAAAGGILNTTTAVTMKAAAGAGLRNYIVSCQLSAEALGAATEVAIRDGAAGTVIWRTKIGTGGLTTGQSLFFDQALKGTANTLLEVVTLSASVTGAVYMNCQGYVAP